VAVPPLAAGKMHAATIATTPTQVATNLRKLEPQNNELLQCKRPQTTTRPRAKTKGKKITATKTKTKNKKTKTKKQNKIKCVK
jgi:hypothetical protein